MKKILIKNIFKNINITHILKFIFKCCRKHFLYIVFFSFKHENSYNCLKSIFFCIHTQKKVNIYYQKTKKSLKKKHVKDMKIFLKKKKRKAKKTQDRYKNVSGEEEEKKCQYHCD